MAVFIFRLATASSTPSLQKTNLTPYLPRAPKETEFVNNGDAELWVARYGAALDKPIYREDGGFTFSHGYLPTPAFAKLSSRMLDEHAITLIDYPESFCAITYHRGRFAFLSAGTGADQLFYMTTRNAIYVTNRHTLLGPFVETPSLRKESFWWMAGRTHIGDYGTYWDQIHRSQPSRKYIFDGDLRTIETHYTGLFDPIPMNDLPDAMGDAFDHFSRVLSDIPTGKRLSLTGGKDSRAILGLLHATGHTEKLKVNTTGARFSPDVMAAQRLTEALAIEQQHRISRPARPKSDSKLVQRITESLYLDFAGRSLADVSTFSYAGDLILGGHEAGIKSALNERPLDRFIDGRKYWADDQGVLVSEVRQELTETYQARLRDAIADVPVAYYDKIEGLEFRVPIRNSAQITASHVGGSQLHPFYDGKIFRIICGISPDALAAQYIPYYFTALGDIDLVSLRFADDAWPDSLQSFIEDNGLKVNERSPQPRAPYQFRDYFPTDKSFGMTGERIDMCDLSASHLLEYLHDNSDFFDFLDLGSVDAIVGKPGATKTFREMYVHLGLLKSAIVHSLRNDLWSRDTVDHVQSTVQDFLRPTSQDTQSVSSDPTPSVSHDDLLLKYEETIATMEDIIVESRDSADPLFSARTSPAVSVRDVIAAANGEYRTIPNDGMFLGYVYTSSSFVIEGTILGDSIHRRSALILVEGAVEPPFKGMVYSAALDGCYVYLSPDEDTGKFRAAFAPISQSEATGEQLRVSLRQWMHKGTLLTVEPPSLALD